MDIQIKRILCPVDFSPSGDFAFEYACAVARRHGASVELLHVTEASAYAEDAPPEKWPALENRLRQRLQSLAARAGVPAEINLLAGIPFAEIVHRAETLPADMIVIGTHGRTGMKHLLIGSVAERVVRTAPCPVLTVRHPDLRT